MIILWLQIGRIIQQKPLQEHDHTESVVLLDRFLVKDMALLLGNQDPNRDLVLVYLFRDLYGFRKRDTLTRMHKYFCLVQVPISLNLPDIIFTMCYQDGLFDEVCSTQDGYAVKKVSNFRYSLIAILWSSQIPSEALSIYVNIRTPPTTVSTTYRC